MPGTTMIIGLSTILFYSFDLFTDLLRQAQKSAIDDENKIRPVCEGTSLTSMPLPIALSLTAMSTMLNGTVAAPPTT